MECLARALSEFNAEPDHVIFTTYQEREDGSTRTGEKNTRQTDAAARS